MKTIFFILKHFYSFLCINLLIFKANKTKIISLVSFLILLWIVLFCLNNQNIKHIIMSINGIAYWIFFVSLFKTLKKQNFFYNLITNRCFYYIFSELLLFLISVYIFFVPINICFLFPAKDILSINFIVAPMSIIADTFLFVICNIWKYVLIQSIIITAFLIYSIIYESNFLVITEDQSIEAILFYVTMIISFIKIIITVNEINKNPKCCSNCLN